MPYGVPLSFVWGWDIYGNNIYNTIMTININGTDLQIKNSFRNYVIYERIAGSTFSKMESLEDILNLFYSCVLASAHRANKTVSVNEFYDFIDANPQSITDFAEWLSIEMSNSNMLNPQTDKPNNNTKTTKKKS